jgi:hypothetical protein
MQQPDSQPITPAHLALIDDILRQYCWYVRQVVVLIGYGQPPELPIEALRQSEIAKELRVIARYAEGYEMSSSGDIVANISRLLVSLFGSPLHPRVTMPVDLPHNFHKTPLGELVHEALCRRTPRTQRVDVSGARQLLGVSRQTIHQWAQDGTLIPIYDKGQLTFQSGQVIALQKKRAAAEGDFLPDETATKRGSTP